MVKIAIVEDEKKQADLLTRYLNRYGGEHDCLFDVTVFENATSFLQSVTDEFNVVFMDIELPDGNGMEVARKMRKTNKTTLIIFVTNLAQYAVKGYEVRAFDFIVKPISYYNFALKFAAALDALEVSKDVEVWIKTKDGLMKLKASRIIYVEVIKHYLTYHTKDGVFTSLGSITSAADQLKNSCFSFCNRCYLDRKSVV